MVCKYQFHLSCQKKCVFHDVISIDSSDDPEQTAASTSGYSLRVRPQSSASESSQDVCSESGNQVNNDETNVFLFSTHFETKDILNSNSFNQKTFYFDMDFKLTNIFTKFAISAGGPFNTFMQVFAYNTAFFKRLKSFKSVELISVKSRHLVTTIRLFKLNIVWVSHIS